LRGFEEDKLEVISNWEGQAQVCISFIKFVRGNKLPSKSNKLLEWSVP